MKKTCNIWSRFELEKQRKISKFIRNSFHRDHWDVCVANNFLGKYFVKEPVNKDIKADVKKVTNFYFGDREIGMNAFENLTNLFTDPGFLYGTDVLVR